MRTKLGDAIQLNLQLFDGASNQYPRAYLYDAEGTELAESPVDLAHVENGLYANSEVSMPSTAQVKAVYKVFSDSGHTSLNGDYQTALDVFNLETNAENSGKVDLTASLSTGIIKASVSTTVLKGQIRET